MRGGTTAADAAPSGGLADGDCDLVKCEPSALLDFDHDFSRFGGVIGVAGAGAADFAGLELQVGMVKGGGGTFGACAFEGLFDEAGLDLGKACFDLLWGERSVADLCLYRGTLCLRAALVGGVWSAEDRDACADPEGDGRNTIVAYTVIV